MNTLRELQEKHLFHTDKHDSNHTFRGSTYLDIYDGLFPRLRGMRGNVLEIGVLTGGSLRLLKQYFLASSVVGIDIDPTRKCDLGAGIHVETGNQADTAFLAKVIKDHGPFKLIIDDGSHVVDHILASYSSLWGSLVPGGIYVIEDLRCTYRNAEEFWPGMNYNQTLPPNERRNINALMLDLIKRMDHLEGDVRKIEFHPMVIAIHKCSLPDYEP